MVRCAAAMVGAEGLCTDVSGLTPGSGPRNWREVMAREPITIDEKKHVTWVTLRAHPDRTLDEILASGVMKIHLEQMDDGL
jgi:hypothetical protein